MITVNWGDTSLGASITKRKRAAHVVTRGGVVDDQRSESHKKDDEP